MTGKNRFGRLAIVLTIAVAVGMSIVVFSGSAYSFEDESNNSFNLELRANYYLNHEDYPILKYEFLVPLYASDDSLLFFSPKYHEDTNDDSHEWQLGLGYRHMILDDRLILGGNVYYDTRMSHTGNEFEQVGLGVEVMGEWFEMRANGYLSLSDAAVVDSRREYYFAERSLSYRDYARYEVPMSGFDAEVGFRLPYVSNYVETWVYGGGYYFEPTGSVGGSVDPMVGYQARVKVAPTDYLHLDFRVRDDNIRGTDYYGSVNVEVPFSIENLVAGKNPFEGVKKDEVFEGSRPLEDRLYAQVERDPDIITGLSGDEVTNNGVLQDLLYVDNTYSGGSSDGSWSDPYTSIAVALGVYNPASEVLFVLAGDTVAGYAGFSVAADNTTIWGQGYDIPGVGLPHGLTADWPVINHAVTINASNVEISGLKFTGSNRNYAVRIADGSGFNLHHNYFEKSGTGHQYGIMAWDLTGDIGTSLDPVVIDGNYFDVESTDFNYGYGILMGTSGTIYADITDNVMDKIHGDRGAFGIYLTSSAGGVETTITGNDMYCYADNIVRGVNIISPGNVMGAIDGNTIDLVSDHNIDGMFLRGYSGSVGTSADPLSISGNDMEVMGETSFGVRIYGDDIYANIDDNERISVENGATGGSNSGIYEIAYTGDIGGSISGNTLDVDGDSAFGVYLRTDGSGSMIGDASDMFEMSDNDIDVDGAAGLGYGAILYADDDIFASITGNDLLDGITGTTANGIYVGSVNGNLGSTATPLEVIDNDFHVEATTGDGYGLFLSASNGTMDYTIADNIIYAYSSGGTWDLDNLGLFDPVYIRADVADGVGSGTLADPYSPGDGLAVGGIIYALDTGGSYSMSGGSTYLGLDVDDSALFAAPGHSPVFTRRLRLNADNVLIMGLEINVVDSDPRAVYIFPGASRVKIRGNTIYAENETDALFGIYAKRTGDLGSATDPLEIIDNTITINRYSDRYDRNDAAGISLEITSGDIYIDISGNTIDVYNWNSLWSVGGVAWGIRIYRDGDVMGSISNNPLIRAVSDYSPHGIYIKDMYDVYPPNFGNVGSVTDPFRIVDNPSIIATNNNTSDGYARGIYIDLFPDHDSIFAEITGNTGIDVSARSCWGIYLVCERGLIGDSSAPFATKISGNGGTIGCSYSIYHEGIRMSVGGSFWGNTNWVDLGEGAPGSAGTNAFTLYPGKTWGGGYAGGVIQIFNFTIPPDRIQPD